MGIFNGVLERPFRWFSPERGRVLYGLDGYPLALSVDLFGRLRVGNIDTIFDSKQVSIAVPEMLFANKSTGTATGAYDVTGSCYTMTVSAIGDEYIRQTRRYFNYQPSKCLLTHQTFAPRWQPGTTIEIGYNDANNGIFYRINDSGIWLVLRSDTTGSVVDNTVHQSDWNRDPLDGRGPSGITIDRTKGAILFSALAWLGLGDGAIGFQYGNSHVICHQFGHANALDRVYMRTPDLPMRVRIYADSTPAVPAEVDFICCSVGSEGGSNPQGVPRGDRSLATTCDPNVPTELMSGRLYGSPVNNHATVYPTGITLKNASNADGIVYICYDPTFSGGSATWRSPIGINTTSRAQVTDGGRTVTVTPSLGNLGHVLYTNEFGPKSSATINLGRLIALGTDVDGIPDEISIIAVNTGGAAIDVDCFVNWVELL